MGDIVLESALDNIREVARKVRHCPACRSEHIYTAINVAYVFDHHHNRMDTVSTLDLAEHSWHGCFDCDHQWVSGPMLQATLPARQFPATARPNKIIDFETARQKMNC
jgi:hypothetical protein